MRKGFWIGALLCGIAMGMAAGCVNSAGQSNRQGMEKYRAGEYMEASRLFGQAISQEGELPESIGSGERLCAGIPGNGSCLYGIGGI